MIRAPAAELVLQPDPQIVPEQRPVIEPPTEPASCSACGSPRFDQIGEKRSVTGEDRCYKLLRCTTCGTVVSDPLPSDDDLKALYTNYVMNNLYSNKRDKKIDHARRRLRHIRRFAAGPRLIDVGCNLGFLVTAARQMGLEPHGIDIDRAALDRARADFGPDDFEEISLEDVVARGDDYDIAYSSEVIEHVRDPSRFAALMARVVKPGGVLYLTTPDAGHYRVPKNFAAWTDVRPPRHLTLFTKEGLRRLFEPLGFVEIHFKFMFKPGIRMLAVKAR